MNLDAAKQAVVVVGDGRGFIVEAGYRRLVITAAHCLPHFPPCCGASHLHERTYEGLLGQLGAEPKVWAECRFADPIADVAVLGSPQTAFAHRDRRLFVNIAAMYMDPSEKATHDAWAATLANSLNRDEAGGYVGFLGEEDEGTVRAAYPGPTWDRLRGLKRRYDPDNLFRLNHNILPADS
jgi:hypothetical protein